MASEVRFGQPGVSYTDEGELRVDPVCFLRNRLDIVLDHIFDYVTEQSSYGNFFNQSPSLARYSVSRAWQEYSYERESRRADEKDQRKIGSAVWDHLEKSRLVLDIKKKSPPRRTKLKSAQATRKKRVEAYCTRCRDCDFVFDQLSKYECSWVPSDVSPQLRANFHRNMRSLRSILLSSWRASLFKYPNVNTTLCGLTACTSGQRRACGTSPQLFSCLYQVATGTS